jgi:ppGpp synthetase/RelA/SpoT-type nucleotidyltranferase
MSPQVDDGLILRCREAHDLARLVGDLLEGEFSAIAKAQKIYTFKRRFKSPASILSKVLRKRAEGASHRNKQRTSASSATEAAIDVDEEEIQRLEKYSPSQITDGFGCRFVTLFPIQIANLVTTVLERLHTFNDRGDRPRVRLKEIVVYTNRRKDDDLSIAPAVRAAFEKSQFKASGAADTAVIDDDEGKKNAYTSVHMTLSVDVMVEHLGRTAEPQEGYVEVQFRDIFEEGWGEIDHFVRYSEKDLAPDDHRLLDPTISAHRSDMERHLRSLNQAILTCGTSARSVYHHYTKMDFPAAGSLALKSVTSRQDDIKAIKDALETAGRSDNVPMLVDAYKLLKRAEDAENRDDAIALYRDAATVLEAVGAKENENFGIELPSRARRSIGYFLQMELANCYVNGSMTDRAAAAKEIYERMALQYPSDPIPNLRLARVFTMDDAKASFELARDVMARAIPKVADDELSKAMPWVAIAAYMQQSYVLGKLGDFTKLAKPAADTARAAWLDEVKNLFVAAADSARLGYAAFLAVPRDVREDGDYPQHGQKVLSNLLYYTAYLVRQRRETPEFNRQRLKGWLAEFETLKTKRYREYFRTEDNAMHAYDAVGDMKQAGRHAVSILHQLRVMAERRAGTELHPIDVTHHLLDDEKKLLHAADTVLRQEKSGT